MNKFSTISILFSCLFSIFSLSNIQSQATIQVQSWIAMMNDPNTSYHEVIRAFEIQTAGKEPAEIEMYGKFQIYKAMFGNVVDEKGFYNWKSAYNQISKFKKKYPNRARSGNWQFNGLNAAPEHGPSPNYQGRVDRIAFHPTNTNQIWVGTPSGGLWKTVDNGQNWTIVSDDWPNLGVGDVIVDANNSNNIYVATGDSDSWFFPAYGIQKSTDGGQTFTNYSNGLTDVYQIYRMVLNPSQTNILYLATEDGLFKSVDGGQNWGLLNSISGRISDVELHPTNPNIVYATVTTQQGLSLTNNDVSKNRSNNFAFEFYKSTDGGGTFNKVNLGFETTASTADDMAFGRIAVSPNNPSVIYVGGYLADLKTTSHLYKSTDSGTSFSIASTGASIGQISGAWTMHLHANPFNANEVYISSVTVRKSMDGGSSWEDYEAMHVDHHDFAWQPGTGILYNANDGGLERRLTNGTLEDLSGIWVTQYFKIHHSRDGQSMIGGCQDVGTHARIDNTWTWMSGGDGMTALIDPVEDNLTYSSAQNGLVVYRNRINEDGTVDMRVILNQNQAEGQEAVWVTEIEMHPFDRHTLYVPYDDVFKTTDAGDSWTNITKGKIDFKVSFVKIAASNPDIIYIARENNELYRTIDGGTNWTELTSPPAGMSRLAVHPENPDKIWVSGWGVHESSDGGQTWQNVSKNLPNVWMMDVVYQPGTADGLYCVSSGVVSVYYTDDSLTDWVSFDSGLPNTHTGFIDLDIVMPLSKIRVGTWGRGIWESDFYSTNTAYQQIRPLPPTLVTQNCGTSLGISAQSTVPIDSVHWYRNGQKVASTLENDFNASQAGNYAARIFSGVYGSYLSEEAPFAAGNDALLGADNACANSVQNFSVPTVENAETYTWQLPNGWIGSSTTNSIAVQVGSTSGTITALVNVGCGTRNFSKQVNVISGCENIVMDFDGTNDYLDIEDGLLEELQNYTIETWFYWDEYPTNHYSLFDMGIDWNGRMFIQLKDNNLIFQISTWDFPNSQWVGSRMESFSAPSLNNWHHVAVSYASATKTATLYLDGVVVSLNNNIVIEPSDIFRKELYYVGRSLNYQNNTYFKGKLDEFRVWNVTRSAAEIQQNSTCNLKGTENGLLVYYNFNDGIPNGDNTNTTQIINQASGNFKAAIHDLALAGNVSNFVNSQQIFPDTSCYPLMPESNECPPTLAITTDYNNQTLSLQAETITASNSLSGTADVTYKASNTITLQTGFYAQSGVNFLATIEACVSTVAPTVLPSQERILNTPKKIASNLKIYPNPFSTETTIEYTLEKETPVALYIVDILGKRVANILDNQSQSAGGYQITFNRNQLKEGTYFVILQKGAVLATKKLLLLK